MECRGPRIERTSRCESNQPRVCRRTSLMVFGFVRIESSYHFWICGRCRELTYVESLQTLLLPRPPSREKEAQEAHEKTASSQWRAAHYIRPWGTEFSSVFATPLPDVEAARPRRAQLVSLFVSTNQSPRITRPRKNRAIYAWSLSS